MNTSTRTQLISLTRDFYAHIAPDFSRTRGAPNPGWSECKRYIDPILIKRHPDLSAKSGDEATTSEESNSYLPRILDLACGNGRFATWLQNEYPNAPFAYLGLDTDPRLLQIAQQSLPQNPPNSLTFQITDIISSLPSELQPTTYDLITAFGLTHHLPGIDYRRKWFASLANLLNPGGIIILTFWQIDQDPRFAKATCSVQTDTYHISESDLEPGDYFLGWDDSPLHRYVHIYSDQERAELLTLLKQQHITLIHSFDSDGRTGTLNHYWILQKQK